MTNETLPALRNDSVIVRLEAARTALSEAKTIQQSKAIADVAAAAEIYARRQKLGEEAIDFAHAVKIEALRKLGELLKNGKDRGEIAGQGDRKGSGKEHLTDIGIDRKTSSMAQKLAKLPEKEFEEVKEGHKSIGQAIAAVDGSRKEPSKESRHAGDAAKLQARVMELEEKLAETKESLAEMTDLVQTLKAHEAGEQVKEMQVLRLELRSCKRRRDELMRESAEQKKLIAYWKKKAGAK